MNHLGVKWFENRRFPNNPEALALLSCRFATANTDVFYPSTKLPALVPQTVDWQVESVGGDRFDLSVQA